MVKILRETEISRYKLFRVKSLDLRFSNSKEATYHIVEKDDSALVVPITKENEVIMIKEYCAAIDAITLGLPKGTVEEGENSLESANKELQEEAGFKAGTLTKLGTVTVSPGNIRHNTHIFLATNLEESKLDGDEEEEIEVLKIPFDEFEKYIENGELTEARMIAALYLARKYLSSHNHN